MFPCFGKNAGQVDSRPWGNCQVAESTSHPWTPSDAHSCLFFAFSVPHSSTPSTAQVSLLMPPPHPAQLLLQFRVSHTYPQCSPSRLLFMTYDFQSIFINVTSFIPSRLFMYQRTQLLCSLFKRRGNWSSISWVTKQLVLAWTYV